MPKIIDKRILAKLFFLSFSWCNHHLNKYSAVYLEGVKKLLPIFCLIIQLPVNVGGQPVQRYSIIITEIFADPSPSQELPSFEFIELKNRSSDSVDLYGWKLSDGSSNAVISSHFILKPDSFVTICSSPAAVDYEKYGSVLGISNFPSLDNDADLITLRSHTGLLIHSVVYDKRWYKNPVKEDGGWTLEMIDTDNPCSGYANWKASIHQNGGTPSQLNSVSATNPDESPPYLLRTYSIDNTRIVAVFDETIDHISANNTANLKIEGLNLIASTPVEPSFREVILQFDKPMKPSIVYQLTVKNITDCSGNTIGIGNTAKAGLPQIPVSFAIIINEILFNPKAGSSDYIEVLNRSNTIIDLKHLYFANRNATGGLNNIKQLSPDNYLLFPAEYIVFTPDSLALLKDFIVKDFSSIKQIPSLPSMPDDKGNIIVIHQNEIITDELVYNDSWHFPLVTNNEGVSLERIDPGNGTQDQNNWTSASSTSGYGTPGYMNSQFKSNPGLQGQITIYPVVFSPDNDGFDDLLSVNYTMTQTGNMASIIVFDISGRPVKYLMRNALLGTAGRIHWSGLDDSNRKLPVGMYVIVSEIYHIGGKSKKFRHAITIARRF